MDIAKRTLSIYINGRAHLIQKLLMTNGIRTCANKIFLWNDDGRIERMNERMIMNDGLCLRKKYATGPRLESIIQCLLHPTAPTATVYCLTAAAVPSLPPTSLQLIRSFL